MRIATRVSAVAALCFSMATAAQAQSANIQALATVFQPITITGARSLDFGNVFPGLGKTVGVADATSGRFDLTGQASSNVNLTFTLPTNLSDGGGNLLPIGIWTGCHNGTNAVGSCSTFTPISGVATPSAFSAAGGLFVWLGGTVTAGASQAAGNYTGTVTLTVAYF
jgi:spore coat protein U-like protein